MLDFDWSIGLCNDGHDWRRSVFGIETGSHSGSENGKRHSLGAANLPRAEQGCKFSTHRFDSHWNEMSQFTSLAQRGNVKRLEAIEIDFLTRINNFEQKSVITYMTTWSNQLYISDAGKV